MFKFKFRVKNKLLIIVIAVTAIIYGSFLYATSRIFNLQSKMQSIEVVQSETEKYAALTKNYFDLDMGLVKALANSFTYLGYLSENEMDTIFGHQMLEVLKDNPKYASVWASFELKVYRNGYKKDYGRKLLVAMYQDKHPAITDFYRDMEGRDTNSDYSTIRKDGLPVIAEPYLDKDISDDYITSIIYPIQINGKFAGLSGVDFPLKDMQKFINQINLSNSSIAYIISNTGIILGHSDKKMLGKKITDIYPSLVKQYKILKNIHNGIPTGFNYKIGDREYRASVIPFIVEGTNTPWALSISQPIENILAHGRKQMVKILIISVFGLIILLTVLVIYARSIAKPLKKANKVFAELAKGKFDNMLKMRETNTGDSLEELSKSVNTLIDSLHKTENYALEIEKGNLDAEFKALGENDRLGNALIRMGHGLRESRQLNQAMRVDEEKARWISDGLAKFAILLRNDSVNFKTYCRQIISELVRYSNSQQGGVYLINSEKENDNFIELVASYAYQSDKFIKRRIEPGEGLIGTSIAEGEFVHLKNVPENYLKIASGLGEYNPTEIIIIPLKNNEKIIGCIELATFKPYDKFNLQFLKEVAESISVTFASIELHNKTNDLLERTRKQAEEMSTQEEVLRQNMEEMMATQEEMKHKEEQLHQILDELEIQEEEMKQRIARIKNL